MNTRLRPGYLDPFINVARIICDGDPPPWLADQLWRWNGSVYHDRHVEDMRPTRTQMRRALLEVEEATLFLTEALAPSWVREFLDASPSGPIADPERLIYALGGLQYRALQAQNSPDGVVTLRWQERNSSICGRNSHARAAASRHVFIATARSVRCV